MPDNYEPLPVDEFNGEVEEAAARGERWPRLAILVALAFVGEDIQCRLRTIEVRSQPEDFAAADITITDDGYLDDSVRGCRWVLRLERTADGPWRLVGARRAFRCWRGRADGTTGWSSAPCL